MEPAMRPEIREKDELSVEAVQRQLKRILASSVFATSTRLSKFLRFGVESALAGRKAINEYSIGVDVFDRQASFDPRIDPTVRVHARRLRAKLAEYYKTEGAEDRIQIELPLRSYIPVLRLRDTRAPQSGKVDTWTQSKTAIAVFPFVNLTPDREVEYFAEGLTREVVHWLAIASGWTVVSATAREWRTETAANFRHLDVQAALSGSVRKGDNKLRISAELTTPDGTVLWSGMHEVVIEDVVSTEEQAAQAICEAMSLQLRNFTPERSYRPDPRVYDLYLKGRYGCEKRDRQGLSKCLLYLQHAIAADPRFAPAHAALAEVLVLLALYAEDPPAKVMPVARAEARRALEYDASSAEAHAAVALVKCFFERDPRGAETEFLRAIELAPKSAGFRQWYGSACLAPLGRFDEALVQLRLAQELDPLTLTIPHDLAFVLCASGSCEPALDQLSYSLHIEPDFALTHWSLGLIYLLRSEHDRAIEEFERASALCYGMSYAEASLAHACASAGDRPRATAILANLKLRSRTRYVPALDLALVHAGLEEYDDALRQIEAAQSQDCAWLIRAAIDPRFRCLRAKPQIRSLIPFPERWK